MLVKEFAKNTARIQQVAADDYDGFGFRCLPQRNESQLESVRHDHSEQTT